LHSGRAESSVFYLAIPEIIHLTQVGDAQHKADGIQNIGFPTAVQPRDGVEVGIEVRHHNPLSIGLETFDGDFLDVHVMAVLQAPPNRINSLGWFEQWVGFKCSATRWLVSILGPPHTKVDFRCIQI